MHATLPPRGSPGAGLLGTDVSARSSCWLKGPTNTQFHEGKPVDRTRRTGPTQRRGHPRHVGSRTQTREHGTTQRSKESRLTTRMQEGPVSTIKPPEKTSIWSDLHLEDRSVLAAANRPFLNVDEMNHHLLPERRRVGDRRHTGRPKTRPGPGPTIYRNALR